MTMVIDGTNGVTFPDNSTQSKTGANATNITAGVLLQSYGGSNVSSIPVFSAVGAGVSTNANTKTKIPYTSTNFQANTTFDTTNYRFLPNVAGYYQINGAIQYQGASSTSNYAQILLYKNGSQYAQGALITTLQYVIATYSDVVYLNGSTDYVEIWAQQNYGASQVIAGIIFSGCLMRGA